MRAVGLVPAAALIAGVVTGSSLGISKAAVLVLLVALVVTGVCWWRAWSLATIAAALVGFLSAGMALGGHAVHQAATNPLRSALDARYGGFRLGTLGPEGRHEPIVVTFRLIEDAALIGGGVSLRASIEWLGLDEAAQPMPHSNVRVSVSGVVSPGLLSEWRAGRLLRAPMTFRRPARYLNDGVEDGEERLAFEGITLLAAIKSGLLIEIVQRGSWLQERAADVRALVRSAVTAHVSVHDEIAGAVVLAVLIGDRTGMPQEIRERLQAAGTYHVIAISGGNIAVLAGLLLLVLAIGGVRGRSAAVPAMLLLIAYAAIVTPGPSVWRATTMALVYFAATAGDHRTPAWQAMALAAAVMVVVDPLDVYDPGFILTFAASGALLEVARRARDPGPTRRAVLTPCLVAPLVASAAIEAVLFPVSAQVFSRISFAGLLLNLIAVPAMAVSQIAGLLTVALHGWTAGADAAGRVAALGAQLLLESARLADLLPWFSVRVPPPGVVLLVTYYLALAGAFAVAPRRRVLAAVPALTVASLIVSGGPLRWSSWVSGKEQAPLQLSMFDVGQAESMLLRLPDGRSVVIDAGGSATGAFDIGARVLAPALWASGVFRLDALLVTHGDPDHIGGARSLVADFRPAQVWTGVPVENHAPETVLRQEAARRGASMVSLFRGQSWRWGEVSVRVLHPGQPDWERRRVRNDDSLVVEVVYRDVAILLTGDVSSAVEREILPMLTPARVRVLKVAHHGSRTSSSLELIAGWKPHVALVSCGRGNQFGHPVREVLERLDTVGARIFRTDRHGQIRLTTDGARVDVQTFVERMSDASANAGH